MGHGCADVNFEAAEGKTVTKVGRGAKQPHTTTNGKLAVSYGLVYAASGP